ncbi:MAG: hypothetical protein OEL52_07045 [Nitrosopumilus sp.]|nr:hypothetical protein [Nitrosopumilus sp.]
MNLICYFAIFLGLVLITGTVPSQAFADVISPRQQMKLDFTAEQVLCGEGLVKIIKSISGKISCVKPSTAEKLAERDWTKPLSAEQIEEIKNKKLKEEKSAGTITKISTLKQLSKKGTVGTSASISGYVYVFEACSNSKIIRAPEIYVTSDSDAKSVKLGSALSPDACYTSSVFIKAADPNSISATLSNRGEISVKILSLETQIDDLKNKITAAKQKIPTTDDQDPNPENLSNIVAMKKDLKNLQDQLRRYLMVLYVPPNFKATKIDILKTITGKPLEGLSASLVSVTESVAKVESESGDLKRFNVVFEACSGKETIRLPIINVVSDSDSVDVKLINRIIPESCQVSVTRINAMDSDSIKTQISGNSEISKVIKTLENEIDALEVTLSEKRSALGNLVSKKLDSDGEAQAEKLAFEISDLRADLLESRSNLYRLMLKI